MQVTGIEGDASLPLEGSEGPQGPDDAQATAEGTYDSFLREVARATDGPSPGALIELRAGTRFLGGRFEIVRKLGSGGMGVVYATRDRELGCTVAVKTLRAPMPDARHRLQAEFLVLYDLAHPNLVSLGELFDDDGRWFFSMELVDGVDFLAHVRSGGALDLPRLRRALAQLAAGLSFLHAHATVHRDVKPSNVLCTVDRLVILDFGLASASGHSAHAGTLPYMPPEQHAGELCGPAGDWYAVGVMLWAALAGRLPFQGDEPELAERKRLGPPAPDGPADLVALAMALLDPDPARRPSDDEVLRRLGVPPPTRMPAMRFVGRELELSRLRQAWADAQDRTAAVLVRGPSGVGKSALLARFADELRDRGAIVLAGRCHERVAMPYKAMHEVAAALALRLREDDEARAVALGTRDAGMLLDVFPSLAEVAGLADVAHAAPRIPDLQQRRARVFDAFADLIANLAARAPLAVMIDDVQWADRDGLALVQHIAARATARLLVVAAARDGRLDPAAAWLEARTAIDVGGLPLVDAEELARQLAGEDAAAAIAREALGHPLHIAELARHWQLGAGDAAPRLDDAIGARVEDLPPDQARVLALVAIAGAAPQAVIGEAAGLDGAGWWPALAALRASHLVRTHGPRGADEVEPYHDRVRETVAARLARGAVVESHARLAAALLARGWGVTRPDQLALHYECAGALADAARWTERAADHAAAALAFDRAAELYQRALVLVPHEPARAAQLHEQVGDALANAGRGARAAEAYVASAALVVGDRVFELRRKSAEQLLRAGHLDEGLRVIEGVFREVGLPAVSRRRWPLASLVVQRALLRVRRWRGPAPGPGSVSDRRKLDCCTSAVVGLAMSSPVRMAEYQARQLRLALATGEPRRIALGMGFEAAAGALAGPPGVRAHARLAELRSLAAEVGEPLVDAYLALAEGTVALLCGHWARAFDRCDAAERAFRDHCVGVAWEIGTASQVALSCLWYMGRLHEMRPRLARALEDADRRGDLYAATELRSALQPIVCLMDDNEAAARDTLARAQIGLASRESTMQHWQYSQSSALVELYAGSPMTASEAVERQLPAARRAYLLRLYVVRAFTAYVRLTSWLGALVAGAPEPARLRASIRRVCNSLDDHDVMNRAVGQLAAAGLAVLRGDLDAAAACYRDAAAGFDAGGMMLMAEAARARLGELLGGDEGRALIGGATAALSREGIVRPDRVIAMLAPVPADAPRLAEN